MGLQERIEGGRGKEEMIEGCGEGKRGKGERLVGYRKGLRAVEERRK